MNYKGSYDGGTEYSIGDVVVFDGAAYIKTKASGEGILPHDKRYWERVKRPIQDIVMMFHGFLGGIQASIPDNISSDAIILGADDDNDYLITVDASGDTPELAVTLVEPEE